MARGERSWSGSAVTVDRGCARIDVTAKMAEYRIGIMDVIPRHLLKFHPIDASSHLSPGVEAVQDDDDCKSGETIEEGNMVLADRPASFIIVDA